VDTALETRLKTSYFDRIAAMMSDDIIIDPLGAENVDSVVDLIRANLGEFEEVGSVLAASYRRVDRMIDTYHLAGAGYFVARDASTNEIIGGAGLGPLAGLPMEEGLGEIREMVLKEAYRGRGIGTQLLRCCLEAAKEFKYQRIYMETTPQMEKAQRLFQRFGFRPVTHAQGTTIVSTDSKDGFLPCYFLLEDVAKALKKGS